MTRDAATVAVTQSPKVIGLLQALVPYGVGGFKFCLAIAC
jgi:hypothetical protein